MASVELPRRILESLLNQARRQPEVEICGLISASEGSASRVFPIRNVAEDRQRRFEMDPAEQIAAMKTMRANGESLFAIYHSHPQAPAWPSETDLAQASYDDALYLIIAADDGNDMTVRGFYLHDDRVEPVDLQIADN